jgi:hypothetical protein
MMERAVYCYGWLPGRPNCHPVHTMKHIGMVEELEKNRATMLSWSMMGSGAISLPFLERQIYGEIPPQLRFHGYLNDKEFNEECLKRGILPYAVVYQAQGWEFPVVLNEDETEILEMNIIRSDESSQTYGLTEFTQDKYHTLFNKVFADYFPDGIYNSDGELVTDLYEECTTRNLYGEPTHSHWLEVTGLPQTCYGMCRNNPVWRTYLKKIVEIQIEAGARAIQLDECETPICSIGYGGCFCKDCMKQFREFLKKKKAEGKLPKEMEGFDLDTFDYGVYLREHHINWPQDYLKAPFTDLYWEFSVEAHNRHFKEIISYVKQYGKEKKNIDVKVSGNFTNMHLLYLPCLDDVDCCITELRRTVFHRHNWFRLAIGYTQDKPLILAESPYDGFMPKFVELVSRGKADDYYRLFIMEAAIHGCSMAFPFGAWMGNATKDCFQAPYKVGTEVQEYLYRHDDLLSKKSGANVLVLYSYQSYMERDWQCGQGENLNYENKDDLLSYSVTYDERAKRMPFFEVTQKMTDSQVSYDVLILGNDGLTKDTFKAEDLAQYDMVVIPDCDWMTENQVAVIEKYAKKHPVCVYGKYAQNQPGALDALRKCDGSIIVEDIANAEASVNDFMNLFNEEYASRRQLFCDNPNFYLQKAITEKGTVVHFLNYAFDTDRYQTIPQDAVIDVEMDPSKRIETYTLSGEPLKYEVLQSAEKGKVRLKLKDVPCYGAILFRD